MAGSRYSSFSPFLALLLFLLTIQQSYGAHTYSGSRYPSSSPSFSDNGTSGRTHYIKIELDEALEKALDNVQSLTEDMRVVKRMLQNLGGSTGGGGSTIGDSENFIDDDSQFASSSSRSHGWRSTSSSSSSSQYKPDSWSASRPRRDCQEVRLSGIKASGVYTIQPDRSEPAFEVYCDMALDGGGWTVFQRRGVTTMPKAVREKFYRAWADYEAGFGSVRSDHWLGLSRMAALTRDCNNELVVNMTAWDGASRFARYATFNISGRSDSYRLSVGNYSGNAGDGLLNHNKMRFSTYDRKNDLNGDEDCAQLYKGAWWYKDCFWSNLNGEYASDGAAGVMSARTGMEWGTRHRYSYMKTEMKIRPKC